MNKMKSVNYIEMANDNDLYQTGSLGFYEIKKMEDNTFSIFDQDNDEIDCNKLSLKEARESLRSLAVDEDQKVSGYGKHSGRKFWQLPIKIQTQIFKAATI